MALRGKLVSQIEIKSPGDLLYEIFSSKQYEIPKICPDKLEAVELHEGDWGTVGSILVSRYIVDGIGGLIANEKVEAIDDKNKSATFNVFGGDLMKLYKIFKMIVQVIKDGESNFVKWTMEYEKLNENVPAPTILMEFGIDVTKAVDNRYLQAYTQRC